MQIMPDSVHIINPIHLLNILVITSMNTTRLFIMTVVALQIAGCNADHYESVGDERDATNAPELTVAQQRQFDENRSRKVEFRIANKPESMDESDPQLSLTETNVLTGRDIMSMLVQKNRAGAPCLKIMVYSDAESRIQKLTRRHTGKTIVILVDSEPKHEFRIDSPFGRYFQISGGMTEAELTDLMFDLQGQGL